MTVNCTNIESVLAPLRKFDPFDNRMISLRSIGFADNPFEPPERRKAWAAVKWTDTSDPPISEWLGITENASSHDDALRNMRVAAFIGFMDFVPVLADGHPWCLLDHQTAGHACSHVRFVARHVLLNAEIEFEWLRIAAHWYNQQLGWDLPALGSLIEYRAQLQRIGLDCNSSKTYRYLKEGFYPVDLSQDVMDRICLRSFGLDSMLGEPRPYGRIEHYAILAIVAPNSD
jgi:hypothetical protein